MIVVCGGLRGFERVRLPMRIGGGVFIGGGDGSLYRGGELPWVSGPGLSKVALISISMSPILFWPCPSLPLPQKLSLVASMSVASAVLIRSVRRCWCCKNLARMAVLIVSTLIDSHFGQIPIVVLYPPRVLALKASGARVINKACGLLAGRCLRLWK